MTKQVTGTLNNWAYSKKQNVIAGYIFNDINKRFPDGTLIQTSKLKPMSMQVSSPAEGVIISTTNSKYLLGPKK